MSDKKMGMAEMLLGCVLCASANCAETAGETPEGMNATPDVTLPEIADSNIPISGDEPEVVAGDVSKVSNSQLMAKPNVLNTNLSAQAPDNKKKGSWWDSILKLFKVAEPQRTSEQAFNDMDKNQNIVIDFSNVVDFAQNGDAKMQEYYQKIVSTKAFGTKSPNIYVNLSNTGVSADFILKWATQFKNDKKVVIWNLSDNKNLNDTVLDALDFPSIYSLNLSGTSVTDAGVAKISAILETNGLGNLVCIHLSNSKVTDAGVAALKTAMQKAIEIWKAKNPGQERKLQGSDNSGVVYEKIPELPQKGSKRQKSPKQQPMMLGSAAPSPKTLTNTPVTTIPESPNAVDSAEVMNETLLSDNDTPNAPLPSVETDTVTKTPEGTGVPEATSSVSTLDANNVQSMSEQEANKALSNADVVIDAVNGEQTEQP